MTAQSEAPDTGSRSLRALAFRAASWSIAGRFAGQALRLASNVVLARLLFPEAFGLSAIVSVFTTGLNMLSDVGIAANIVQSRRAEEPAFLNTAWTVQILRGVWVTLGAAALAWPMARFYGEPQLLPLLAVAGLGGLLQGFESVAMHTQRRVLDLSRVVQVELLSVVIALPLMIAWAWWTRSVWALVGGGLLGALAKTILTHVVLPRHPHRIQWDREALREMRRFGSWIFLSSALTFVAMQGDRLLLGYYLGTALLGVYHVATRFTEALRELQVRLVRSVLFPALSETARDNPELLTRRFYRARAWTDGLFLSATGLLGSLGQVIVNLLYDDRYADAGWIIELLSIQVGMSIMLTPCENLLFSIGETYYGFARSLVKALWILVGIPIAWHFAGLPGIAWCVASSELPVAVALWSGMWKKGLLRPLLELRSLAIWGASAFAGWCLAAALR